MTKRKREIIPTSTKAETALDVGATVASAVPWLGGPVSSVLSGISVGRKISRVKEVLESMANDLKDFQSQASETYVKTDEFQDLLEKTLRGAAQERSEEKRRIYASFLTGAVKSSGESYNEQLVFLRELEQLQPDHIRVVQALVQEPEGGPSLMGSPIGTLQRRLPDIPTGRIEELVGQLNDMRITKLTSLRVMMTGHGAANLQGSLTAHGQRFLTYMRGG